MSHVALPQRWGEWPHPPGVVRGGASGLAMAAAALGHRPAAHLSFAVIPVSVAWTTVPIIG